MMLIDERAALLERHISGSRAVEEELGLLATQPSDKQEVVLERLRAVDWYLALESPPVRDADAAAARIGVSRRQFYRLLAKVRDVGPIRALIPGFRNIDRAAVARDGLGEVLEAQLFHILSADAEVSISTVERLIEAHCIDRGIMPPKESSVRRRVQALRRSGLIGFVSAEFGERLVIDQSDLNLPVESLRGPVFATATLIIDRATKLIVGAGLAESDGIGMGLEAALSEAWNVRIPGFKTAKFPVAPKLQELTWIVPPGLESVASAIGSAEEGVSPSLDVVATGPRRHGEALLRLLGDRLGPYEFRLRATMEEDAELADRPGCSLIDASRLFRFSADHWNKKIISSLPQSNQDEQDRIQRLDGVIGKLESLFLPVDAAIDARFAGRPYDGDLWI